MSDQADEPQAHDEPTGAPPPPPGDEAPPTSVVPPTAAVPPVVAPPGWSAPPPGWGAPPGAAPPAWGLPAAAPPGWGAPGPAWQPAPAGPSNGIAIAALITGIASLVLCGLVVLGVVAVVLGIVGVRRSRPLGGTGKGQAIAGIVLGALSILAGIVVWAAVVGGVAWLDRNADELYGTADRSDYDVTIDDCDIDRSGAATARGEIENTSDRRRNYLVEIEFTDDLGDIRRSSEPVFDVAPDGEAEWEITAYLDGDDVRCRVSDVRNILN